MIRLFACVSEFLSILSFIPCATVPWSATVTVANMVDRASEVSASIVDDHTHCAIIMSLLAVYAMLRGEVRLEAVPGLVQYTVLLPFLACIIVN
jgi:hypothetical protein